MSLTPRQEYLLLRQALAIACRGKSIDHYVFNKYTLDKKLRKCLYVLSKSRVDFEVRFSPRIGFQIDIYVPGIEEGSIYVRFSTSHGQDFSVYEGELLTKFIPALLNDMPSENPVGVTTNVYDPDDIDVDIKEGDDDNA